MRTKNNPEPLPIAVRAYPQRQKDKPYTPPERSFRRPDAMLVSDTETRTDTTQKLLVGSYRYVVSGACLEEGLFYPPDLSPEETQLLEKYVETHRAETARAGRQQLFLLPLRDFLNKFYRAAYKGRCLVVGFNLPFDFSRIASDSSQARGRFAGGFSLGLWTRPAGKDGDEKPNKFRPRIGIKQMDSKRALKGFTAQNDPDRSDLIPEGSLTGKPEKGYKFRGHFLDLRTLAFALTDRSYTLESACEEFGVEHGKQSIKQHGILTEEYIDYNRRDVLATYELALKLLEEFEKNPIALQATKAYSPASIGKAYLREMGIKPILERQPNFSKKHLGYAQSAFLGGRTSTHIRKTLVPVGYTDFISMYPTVNNLMQLWRFVTAEEIKVVDHCQKEIQEFLNNLSPNDLFKPETWQQMTTFVRVVPHGDILPSRAKYSSAANDWQVGVNKIYGSDKSENGLWYSLPDIVASVILTGHIPKIIDAFRIEADGKMADLKPIKLRGAIEINPRYKDFFKVVIEERKQLESRTDLPPTEKDRLDKALKVLANATSYGIYAEMIREESEHKLSVTCYGIDAEPFTCRVAHPDDPGAYCFPPLASLITGAARLMLALLEYSVEDAGGTYAMEDTDSMAIVATQHGGLIPCAGGKYLTNKKLPAIQALSWKQVDKIVKRFAALNPYDRDVIPGSILKIEKVNYDSSNNRRQIYCYAISAKRYALAVRVGTTDPELVDWKEHGLGHLLNPTDPESADRDWIKQVWLMLIRKALKLPIRNLAFENTPAISRCSISSPAMLRPLAFLNEGKRYCDQIKPFNFLLTCHVSPFGHPIGTQPERFHLIAPYDPDPKNWLKQNWVDQYSGKIYRITTEGAYGTRDCARVQTYGDVIREYEFHPEAKCADLNGDPCHKETVGLLSRREISVAEIKYIGKESNLLEEVEAWMIHSQESVYTFYPDKRRDEWEMKTRPALKKIPLPVLTKETGISRRALIDARTGRSRPYPRNQELLAAVVKKTS